ncbi:MAG: hypothetical protein JXQ72_13415, partial [Anaerolineae bacterium]|nr:hypothetical protein [Anaerolineae bacterium]
MRKNPVIGGILPVLLLAAALAVAAVGGVSGAAAQGGGSSEFRTLDHDGLTRSYTLYVPSSYDGETAAPLLVVLHPFASSSRAMEIVTGFDDVAEAQGALVVYPDVADLGWDEGMRDTGWPSGLARTDDTGFIAALVDHLAADYAIDESQVFLAGWGDGGTMAHRLACEQPERYAGIASYGGQPWDYHTDLCPDNPGASVSVLMLVGTEDVNYPVQGRTETTETADGTVVVRALDVYHAALWWANRNHCDRIEPEVGNLFTDYVYEGCDGGATVRIHLLPGVGGIVWPRVGEHTLNQFGVDATDIIAEFFFGELDDSQLASHALDDQTYGPNPRGYMLYVPPSYDPAEPMPLVLALHGRPGTATGTAYLYDLNRVAAEEGFIAVYPEGQLVVAGERGREWNYTRGTPGYQTGEVDDVAFLDTVIDDIALSVNVDRQRVYVTGFSNGGFMTQRLACEAAGTYAAFAEVGSALFPHFITVCEDQPPVPILIMHGTADASIPWEGLVIRDQVLHYSVPDTMIFWAIHDKCEPNAVDYSVIPPQDPAPTTSVHRYLFTECAPGTEVLYYVIEGGGHNLPGLPDRLEPEIASQVNTDIHASKVIWEFLSQFTLPDTAADAAVDTAPDSAPN